MVDMKVIKIGIGKEIMTGFPGISTSFIENVVQQPVKTH